MTGQRFEIEHAKMPDGTPCGHVAVGETEDAAEVEHLHHCLSEHEWSDEVREEIEERLAQLEGDL